MPNNMTLKEFINELKGNRVEGELLKTIFISLFTSFIALAILYYLKLKTIPEFMPKYGFFLFFAVLSYAFIMPAIRQVRAFKEFPCMSGMMIGMTIGMISGFLAGFYVGATNGMFWGGVFGMAVGIFLGVWKGKCCGVMGVMEGLMAGFMGGLMGAMTAVMMFNDNLKSAAIVIFIVCASILLGLNYMLYKETKNEERIHREDYFLTVFLSFILTGITIYLMVLGPRSALLQ
jgi:asparagine N-glycosylation enzyme membrane subunit Stt3